MPGGDTTATQGSPRGRAATFGLALALAIGAAPAAELWAHPLAPPLLEIREQAGGIVEVTWKTPALVAPGAHVRPALPSTCTATGAPRTAGGDAQASAVVWTVGCNGGLGGARFGVDGLDSANPQALLRLTLADGRVMQRVLTARDSTFIVPDKPQPLRVASDYMALGLEHVATGADHLLFVLGLLLLIPAARSLAVAILAFTLGHSAALALSVLGYASLPSQPIAVGIALSVFALAVELTRQRGSAFLRRFAWIAAAGFGLLHGLDFAGALRQIGLPATDAPLAILSFNGGIELGLLAFVAAVLAAGRAASRLPLRLRLWAPQLPVYAMGSLAVLWSLQRAAALLP